MAEKRGYGRQKESKASSRVYIIIDRYVLTYNECTFLHTCTMVRIRLNRPPPARLFNVSIVVRYGNVQGVFHYTLPRPLNRQPNERWRNEFRRIIRRRIRRSEQSTRVLIEVDEARTELHKILDRIENRTHRLQFRRRQMLEAISLFMIQPLQEVLQRRLMRNHLDSFYGTLYEEALARCAVTL